MDKIVVWITGASTGIGREIAKRFAKDNIFVIVSARRKSRLVSLVSEIKFSGGNAAAIVCDVSSERSVQNTVRKINEKYGKISVLINNAGSTVFKSFVDTKITEFDNIIGTNLRGAFICMKTVVPQMLKIKKGHIINILSVAAVNTMTNSSVYSASKAALLALSKCMREEIRKDNIKITNILPGATETPMWDAKTRQKKHNRMMSPAAIADIVYFSYSQPKNLIVEDIIIRPQKGDL